MDKRVNSYELASFFFFFPFLEINNLLKKSLNLDQIIHTTFYNLLTYTWLLKNKIIHTQAPDLFETKYYL